MKPQGKQENEPIKVRVEVTSEYGTLREAVVGYYPNYYRKDIIGQLKYEIENLKTILLTEGVKVLQPDPVPDSRDQVTPRDIAFVVGSILVIGSMVEERRRNEWTGLKRILETVEGRIVIPPEGVQIEGGDILVDGENVFVGISERTSFNSLSFIKKALGEAFTVCPVETNALHLDLALNILSRDRVVYYPKRIKRIPRILKETFAMIETTRDEYAATCINILSLGNNKILIRKGFTRLNATLEAEGFDVLEIPFDVVPLKSGGIRCTVLPLIRT